MSCLREQFEDGVVLDGRYRTITPLNHGSFGMVFMAEDLETGEDVAIKCLTKKSAADEASFDFAIDDKSEELVLHRLLGRHPNIVNLIDSFETESHVYIVLEFCERGDLYEAIRKGQGPLETEHVRRFMLELVDAVAYIHSKGIYHRDIKPENIFLSHTGSMKLGDFGLATTDKWTHETTVGSDRYMSPEQYDSAGAGYSPAQADIWAIGICLLNILFSRNPFTTPTEADPLFLDFSRDKQSLFDVFPSMSQDTYEVIVQCMNLDPTKRSLVGARNALRRVVSFTTLDEALDEFCSTDRCVIASANREPLRTPSIQSPQVEEDSAYPWTKALHTGAKHPLRQLSAIPDDESYTEELFSKSEATTADWCSSAMTGETPSSLGASMNSLAISQPMAVPSAQFLVPQSDAFKVSPMAGSLPINMSRNRNAPSMSLVFGRKDGVSKSWSDLWDEEEEEEAERARQLEALKKMNARTWSQDSVREVKAEETHTRADVVADKSVVSVFDDDDNTPRQGLSPATKTLTMEDMISPPKKAAPAITSDDFADEALFFADPVADDKVEHDHEHHLGVQSPFADTAKSPSSVDKWEALGEKRRAYAGSSSPGFKDMKSPRSPQHWSMRTGGTHALDYGYNAHGNGLFDYHQQTGMGSQTAGHINSSHSVGSINSVNSVSSVNNNNSSHYDIFSSGFYSGQNKWNAGKDRTKECPWNKGRGWNWGWRRDKRPDCSSVEWVGGW